MLLSVRKAQLKRTTNAAILFGIVFTYECFRARLEDLAVLLISLVVECHVRSIVVHVKFGDLLFSVV